MEGERFSDCRCLLDGPLLASCSTLDGTLSNRKSKREASLNVRTEKKTTGTSFWKGLVPIGVGGRHSWCHGHRPGVWPPLGARLAIVLFALLLGQLAPDPCGCNGCCRPHTACRCHRPRRLGWRCDGGLDIWHFSVGGRDRCGLGLVCSKDSGFRIWGSRLGRGDKAVGLVFSLDPGFWFQGQGPGKRGKPVLS